MEDGLAKSENSRSLKVEIFGQQYPIRASVEDEEYIRRIARYVDEKMREIDESMGLASTQKIAILAALNIADELFTLQDERDQVIAEYQEKARSFTEALEQSLEED